MFYQLLNNCMFDNYFKSYKTKNLNSFMSYKTKKKASFETFIFLMFSFSIHPHSRDNHLL